jgi:hypothetical protein
MIRTIETLMTGLIDYAGLFPPSKLPMNTAVENYAKYLRSEHEQFLSRFICTANRLDELSKHGAMLMPGTFATSGYRENADMQDPWQVSAVIVGDLNDNLDMIYAFNEKHDQEENGLAMVDVIEMKISSPNDIDEAMDTLPAMIAPAFELPREAIFDGDPRGFIAALAGNQAAAKIRCGGVSPDLFPSSADIARFMHACNAADVPFKATAGLHHPIRSEHALTYEPDAPKGIMHGFVNVFLAGAFVRSLKGFDLDTTIAVLNETDSGAFVFSDEQVAWRDVSLPVAALAQVREFFATSYGSCSFDEPRDDLRAIGLL